MTTIEIKQTKKVQDLEPKFTKFLESDYPEVIDEISEDESPELYIDYEDLEAYDSDLAEGVVNEPESFYAALQSALQQFDMSQYPRLEHALVRIENSPKRVSIRNLRGTDVYNLINVEGRIKKTTDVRPRVEVAAYRCSNCDYVLSREQSLLGKMTETPGKCPDCETNNTMSFDWGSSYIVDFQRLDIEEAPEGLTGGETPQSLPVYISGNITGRTNPGEHVTITGLLEPEQSKQKTAIFDTRMRGSHVHREDEDFEDIDITDEDKKLIIDLSEDPEIYKKLIDSVAPAIWGNKYQKLATLMSLFGGVTKEVGGSYLRGDIHVLLVGDPGTAKSQILRYIHSVSPRGIYTSGKGSSSAGLTAAAVQEESLGGEKAWTLEAGALVLADKGIAAIDELDKMSSEDRSALHEALEQQTVSIAKAGINATLKSRCALISAANPIYGRFDPYEPLAEQIELEPALISRFDLIFTMVDEPDVELDSAIADHILITNQAGTDKDAEEEVEPAIDQELLRKYVAYARNNCRPTLPDDVKQQLKEFYVNIRNEGRGEGDPVPATARKLQGLIRLAEASAKMRLSDVVETEDANRAIDIAEECMQNVGMDPETGEFDADVLETGSSKSQRDRKKAILDIVEGLESEHPDGVPIEDIIDVAEQEGFKEKRVRDDIETLYAGLAVLYCPQNGHYITT
jgi:replicative DNA helicase Mcm